jgi:hypothetical protein
MAHDATLISRLGGAISWSLRCAFVTRNAHARLRTSRRAGRWLLGSNGVRPPLSPPRNTSTSGIRAVLLPTSSLLSFCKKKNAFFLQNVPCRIYRFLVMLPLVFLQGVYLKCQWIISRA